VARWRLYERYGCATQIDAAGMLRALGLRRTVHPRDVLAFRHDSAEAAQAYAAANIVVYDHTVFGPYVTEVGSVWVLDLRPAMFRLDVPWTDPTLPDDYRAPWRRRDRDDEE